MEKEEPRLERKLWEAEQQPHGQASIVLGNRKNLTS